ESLYRKSSRAPLLIERRWIAPEKTRTQTVQMPRTQLAIRHTTIGRVQAHAQLEREACEQTRRQAVRAAHREEDFESGWYRAEAFGEMSGGKLDESGNR